MAEKKAYICLLTRGAKPISFYCIHKNLFQYIFTHLVIPFLTFCALHHVPCVYKNKTITVLNTCCIQVKTIF